MSTLHPAGIAPEPRLGIIDRLRRRRVVAQLDLELQAEADRLHLLAVLSEARRLVEESWVRGAWFAIRDGDGRTRFVRGGASVQLTDERIVGSCIVGSIIRAANTTGAHEQPVQRALDAVWHALNEDETTPVRWCPPPLVRLQHMRDLTRWNDRLAEGPGEVADLLLTAERVALSSAVDAHR